MAEAQRPEILWQPSDARKAQTTLARYMAWLADRHDLRFSSYEDLWRWSVADLERFWTTIWEFFEIRAHAPSDRVLTTRRMPGARWFQGATLNYAEHALRRRDEAPAVFFLREGGALTVLTFADLYAQTSALAAALRRLGVGPGDRVVGYMPNIPQTLVAFLAAASLGAVWSTCSPELGVRAVVDRFHQLEPRVMFAVDGYRYRGRAFDRRGEIAAIRRGLPSLRHTVVVPYLEDDPDLSDLAPVLPWHDLLAQDGGALDFTPVPFNDPLWVVYSSGTTGLPKGIVHGHGGILLEHFKFLGLQLDIQPGDRFFWFTTTSWVMWNILMGALLLGASVVMYDGDPGYPDLRTLWRLAQDAGITHMGVSPPFLQATIKAGLEPGREFDLGALKALGSTGAPLPAGVFRWVYEHVKQDLHLASVSGGTDVATAFVGSAPTLPVRAGELQCRQLGVAVAAFDEEGREVVDAPGELVIQEPMPSMPVFFWNDPEALRYRESYFEQYPGIWRHGDWVRFHPDGACVVYGRSDATLKRGGVRMGTSEFYRVLEEMPEVVDSLVVDTSGLDRDGRLLAFVVLADGLELDDALRRRIADTLRRELSPRHVPDAIVQIPEVPRTLNGKKMEVPVRRILTGTPPETAVNREAMSNPGAMDFFIDMYQSERSLLREAGGDR